MRIAIGADELGLDMKETLVAFLLEQEAVSVEVVDFGTDRAKPADYPDIAIEVARAITRGEADRGILICGTGIGMSIAANKVHGVRAALCHDVYSGERAIKSNNAQVLTMGALVIGMATARTIVEAWLPSVFAGGGSERKVAKIDQLDRES